MPEQFQEQNSNNKNDRDTTFLPKEVIDEALNTLAFLFPKWDSDTRIWYRYEASIQVLDTYMLEIGHLDADKRRIENFVYWRNRLVVLKQVFDEARPSTL